MPRVNTFKVEITTGETGNKGPVQFDFNGHTMEFHGATGGTGPGETFEGSFDARSFAHSVALVGPNEGKWAIERLLVTYVVDASDPYTVLFANLVLDDSQALDIWRDKPLAAFDV